MSTHAQRELGHGREDAGAKGGSGKSRRSSPLISFTCPVNWASVFHSPPPPPRADLASTLQTSDQRPTSDQCCPPLAGQPTAEEVGETWAAGRGQDGNEGAHRSDQAGWRAASPRLTFSAKPALPLPTRSTMPLKSCNVTLPPVSRPACPPPPMGTRAGGKLPPVTRLDKWLSRTDSTGLQTSALAALHTVCPRP